MKKIENKVTKVEVSVSYEAIDGKVFYSEDECKEYEKSAACAIRFAFKDVPCLYRASAYDCFLAVQMTKRLILSDRRRTNTSRPSANMRQ